MKHIITLLVIILSLYNFANAQDTTYTRKGFYTNLGIGVSMNSIYTGVENDSDFTYSGAGTSLSFLIGGSLQKNLILHALFYGSGVINPTIKENGNTLPFRENIKLGTRIIGGGVTIYNKDNFFFSPNIGFSKIRLDTSSQFTRSDAGLGIFIRAGKDWWLGEKWSGGISLSYLHSSGSSSLDMGENEKWSSNSVSLVFSLSIN